MKFFRRLIHLLKAPDYKPPIEYELTDEEKLFDLVRKYHFIEDIKNKMVKDIKTKKRLKYKLEWIKGDIIKLALKI